VEFLPRETCRFFCLTGAHLTGVQNQVMHVLHERPVYPFILPGPALFNSLEKASAAYLTGAGNKKINKKG